MADKFDRCLRFEKHKNYSYVTEETTAWLIRGCLRATPVVW
jgi:hypothetical protein